MQMPLQNHVFEEAGKFRDRIIERIQKTIRFQCGRRKHFDIIGFYREEKRAVCVILKMKNGAIIHQEKLSAYKFGIMKNRIVSWRAFYNFTMLIEKEMPRSCYLSHLKIWITRILLNCSRYPKEV